MITILNHLSQKEIGKKLIEFLLSEHYCPVILACFCILPPMDSCSSDPFVAKSGPVL